VAAKHGPAAPPAQAGPRRPLAHLDPLMDIANITLLTTAVVALFVAGSTH